MFPWIGAKHSDDEIWSTDWWYGAVDDASAEERREYIAAVVELAIERHGTWPIGELFPGLPDTPLTDLRLPTRAQNVVSRLGARSTVDVAELTTDDLLELRGMGVGSLEALLFALADAATVPLQEQVARSVDDDLRPRR